MKHWRKWLSFLLLTLLFSGVGHWLAWQFQFLTEEGTFLSSRAMIAGRGDPASLQNIGLVYPPLAFYLAVPLTWFFLPHPAIWLSAAWGSAFCLWMRKEFRTYSFRHRMLGGLVFLLPLQPGIFHSATTGTTFIAFAMLFTIGLYLVARFAIDQQMLDDTRHQGSMSAWVNSDQYMNERVRYLWSAALCFGIAGFCRFELLLGLLVFLPITPLLLPVRERREIWKMITLALLLFLPLFATQFIWTYLTWVFTDDFFYAFKNPSTYFRQVSSEVLSHSELILLKGKPLEAIGQVMLMAVIGFPVYLYLLLRIRNLAVAILFATPFLVEGLGVATGLSLMSRSYLAFAGVLSLVLFLLCAIYRRTGRVETYIIGLALILCTAWSWIYFSESPYREERVWKDLVTGNHEAMIRFADERRLLTHIRDELEPDELVLMDDQQGYAVIALSNDPDRFILPYQKQFVTALQNPSLLADAAAYRIPSIVPGLRDRVAERWWLLDRRSVNAFTESERIGPWYFHQRTFDTAPRPLADSIGF